MDGYEALIASKDVTETPAAETPSVAEVAPETAPVVETPVTSETPVVETPLAADAPVVPQDHSVPLPVFLRQRDDLGGKLTVAEQRALAAERQLAEIRRTQEEATAQMPHPLDAPEEFASWLIKRQQDAVNKAVGLLDQRYANDRQEISRVMMEQHLGAEKFAELSEAIKHAPQWLHDKALLQSHPWGYMLQEFNRVKEHKRAQEALSQLGGKSIEEIVAERLAAELAKQTQAATPAAVTPGADTRQRNPDGTFAPSPQPARHEPPSLSVVAAASAPRGEDARGGYDALFKRG